MQVSVADAGTLRKQVTVTYDAGEVASRESQLLQRYANQMNVKGFRNGKVPANLVKKRYGAAVRGEIQEALANEGLNQAITDNELKPIGPVEPEENELGNDGLKLVASFDVCPAIELPAAESLEVPIEETSASADEINEELDALSRRSGDHQDLADGDTVAKDDAITLAGAITAGDETVREIHDLNHLVGAYPLF
ncbi:MAG: trigger factor family protein, partial [Planctomycetota bacterium]